TPPLQVAPPRHCDPHLLQLNGSLCRLTQALAQLVRPPPHMLVHTPPEQTSPCLQATPHPPQSVGSLLMSVHTPLQRMPLLGHTHWLLVQTVPPPQRVPQAPQLVPSVVRFTHD